MSSNENGRAPTHWKRMPLGAVVDILDSRRVPVNAKEREGRQGNVPYYGATGQVGWIDDHLFDEELVLLGEDGAPFFDSTKQKAYLVRGRSWVNNHAHVLRTRNGMPSAFLKHQLDQVDYRPFVSGTTRAKLPQGPMRQIGLLVPPVEEQKLIVAAIESHFSRLDAATATLERVQRNLERYRASVLKAAVEGRLVPTEAELAKKEGRSYEPASVLLKRILAERRRLWEEAELAKLKAKGKPPTDDGWKAKYEEPSAPDANGLPELPEGWCWASVDQCFEILPGVGIPEKVQGTGGKPIPVFKVGEISRAWQRGERFLHSSANTLDEAQALELTRHLFPANTIVFAKIGAALALNRRAITATPSVLDNNCMGLACVSVDVSLLYAFHFLCTVRLGYYAKATTVPSVRKTEVARLPVPLPPQAEQARIASQVDRVLSVAGEARAIAKAGLAKTSRLRQSILKWAFEGRLT